VCVCVFVCVCVCVCACVCACVCDTEREGGRDRDAHWTLHFALQKWVTFSHCKLTAKNPNRFFSAFV